ncbi:MAG: phosphotransferase [Planctomycetales bacterium]|nr:phosphotransferase [Planctomycetales bacterium]
MHDTHPIVDIFRERYEAQFGEVVRSVRVVEFWARTFSEIYLLEFTTDSEPRRIIGKRIIHHASNDVYTDRGNPAQIEFDALNSLDFSSIENCNVPTPWLIDTEKQCYFMDFVDGAELESLMGNLRFFVPRTSFLQLGQVYFQAGRWLSHFQRLTNIEFSDERALESVVLHCNHRLQMIAESRDYRIPRYFRQVVLEQIEHLLQYIQGPIPVAGCHGDFGPWNMIMRGDELTVIDFYSFRREFIAIDPTNILVNLENQRAAPSFSRRRIDLLARQFIAGYGVQHELDLAALEIAEIFYRVCSIHGSIISKGDHLRERLRTHRILRRNLSWLMNANQRQSVWNKISSRTACLA